MKKKVKSFAEYFYLKILSPKTALFFFLLSVLGLILCFWKESDEIKSYFTQDFYISPTVLVISSDDWGGAIPPETVEDLEKLEEALSSVKDANGKPLVLTAYINPAEPDFEKIIADNYTSYSYRYCYLDKPEVASKLRKLNKNGLVDIEFHGREHFNIPLWLDLLKNDYPGYRKACDSEDILFREGPSWNIKADPRLPYIVRSFIDASVYPPKALPVKRQIEMLTSGLNLMETEFGVKPLVFTPSGYCYDTNTLEAMYLTGLFYLDSVRKIIPQVESDGSLVWSRKIWDYGSNISKIKGIVRNSSFEPYKYPEKTASQILNGTMISARRAILSGRPIVISSHRWNYVESVNTDKDRMLKMLQKLVRMIQAEAPDILFLGSSDLVKELYMKGEENHYHPKLRVKILSGKERIFHGLLCTWLGHGRIRMSIYMTIFLLVWLVFNGKVRKFFNKAPLIN